MVTGYQPLKITGPTTGLVQNREEFLLPDDAYPILQNAYVWRERILRKQGYQLLGRLQRTIDSSATYGGHSLIFNGSGVGNIITDFLIESTSTIIPGSVSILDLTSLILYTDPLGNGTLSPSGSINYATGVVTILAAAGHTAHITITYYPGLPVMGLRQRENQTDTFFQTIAFDQKYAYNFNGTTWQEFIPGTTWNANNDPISGINFFWSTNFWVGDGNKKIFWVTNDSWINAASPGDPIRYTNAVAWVDFSPIINAANDVLVSCLCMLPFRGRLVTFNTVEGPSSVAATTKRYSNRIRWSAIGTPFTVPSSIVTPVNANAWRDDIRGQGGFLDIPTSEDIVSVGFVRDNLVIYCQRSTWQLRYTGRTIAPFQIEKVNSENGAEGTFSTIQFDTSLLGIGDKGILECDSFKSELIDVKIPDLVFNFQNANNGPQRIHGMRDFIKRLAYWTIPASIANGVFPDQRLIYNYENDSWALFNDSLTALGSIQVPTSRTWINTHQPWIKLNFPWTSQPLEDPVLIGGNQQGFVEKLDIMTINDISLYIKDITGNGVLPLTVTSPAHNMKTGFVIQISGIPDGTPFDYLNEGIDPSTNLPYNVFDGIYGIIVLTANTFQILGFDSATQQFSIPQILSPGVFVGVGNIAIRENFTIVSKKFSFIDQGQSIQMGYIDILMDASEEGEEGAISLNVYLDYNGNQPSNTDPRNAGPDTFFNSVIPTSEPALSGIGGSKFWHRVICPTRANFLTLEYKFSNAQMAGLESETDVQIDAQILWVRPSGRITSI